MLTESTFTQIWLLDTWIVSNTPNFNTKDKIFVDAQFKNDAHGDGKQ